jgi:hypothetical protein
MTAQHLDSIIEAQRKLLWMLPQDERERRLAEVRADYVYELLLEGLAGVMASEAESAPCDLPSI